MTASTRSAVVHVARTAPPPPHIELAPGTMVGRYRVAQEVGRGSYAVVYRAVDPWLEREVALKTLRTADGEPDPLTEARLLSQVRHRHVVEIHDVVSHGEVRALVLELVSGPPLTALVRQAPLEIAEVVDLGTQLLMGVAALHDAGILHRDIKPGNVRLADDGVLKILDLGVACRLDGGDKGDACGVGPAVGTVPYMSPERLRGCGGDVRSDLWSAGAVIFELATGRRLVDELTETARDRFVCDGLFPDPWDLASALPYPLAGVVARVLAPDPSARYPCARQMLDDLARVAAPAAVAA